MMVRFDHRCPDCDSTVETTSTKPPTCECGTLMLRLWSSPGVVLRGTGWAGKTAR